MFGLGVGVVTAFLMMELEIVSFRQASPVNRKKPRCNQEQNQAGREEVTGTAKLSINSLMSCTKFAAPAPFTTR
jgi:hypothetical protein